MTADIYTLPKRSDYQVLRRHPATLLTIVHPVPMMLREFREATKRMEQIGRLGNPVEVRRAAEVLEAMRENIVLVAKSPFVKRI